MNRISKTIFHISLCLVIGLFVTATPLTVSAAKDTPTIMVPANFSELAKAAKPSVVNIRTETTVKGGGRVFRHFFGGPQGKNPFEEFWGPQMENEPSRDYKQRSLGSGFIIDKEGYIVTNNHVVENADQIRVKLADDKEYDATLVGRDSKTDLALIKIETSDVLTPIKMGDSGEINVGDWVLAIGSPFGLEQTLPPALSAPRVAPSVPGNTTISSRRTRPSTPATAEVPSSIWPVKLWASTQPSSPVGRESGLPFPSTWPRASLPSSKPAERSPGAGWAWVFKT